MSDAGGPHIVGVPPGADFVECLFARLADLSKDLRPEEVAQIHVLLPTRRMQRRLKHLYELSDRPLLLPRVGLVTDVSGMLPGGRRIQPVSSLRRILDLKDVVAQLVALDPRLSESDVIDLTSSLTELLDEMQGEDVGFDRIMALQPDDQSGHWAQSLSFLTAIRAYAEALGEESMDGEALHRAEVLALCAHWEAVPPTQPVILAGSTGSRSTTRHLMAAVAKLPRGEVVLPGFDFCLPDTVWSMLSKDRTYEDHPQYRFAAFLNEVGCDPLQVRRLGDVADARQSALVSLSLRPAPVTNAWLEEGPALGPLDEVTAALSLIEARDPKDEAAAIALAMRAALEDQKSVALISPDATLSRRIAAALSRWGIRPDDSGGVPLSLTPYGRFLRQTASFAMGKADPVSLMALLKHPMTRAGDERGELMRRVQEFEVFLRKRRVPEVTPDIVRQFAQFANVDADWVDWLIGALEAAAVTPGPLLSEAFDHHMSVLGVFAGREKMVPDEDIDPLLDRFRAEANDATRIEFVDYVQLLERALAADSARQQEGVRPDVMIWGSLEARVQGADVIIIAGLNEGVWPAEPKADPWLNRSMRRQVGLLLPERQIGLAGHDYQQAIGSKDVLLTRSARSDGSETVPSRWLSRLLNLLNGLEASGGKLAVKSMKDRGEVFLRSAMMFDRPDGTTNPVPRPAPSPPIAMRPRQLAVTDIKTLIQDPYAIYAKRVLRLREMDPLVPSVDARERGIVFHNVLEAFYDPANAFQDKDAERLRLRDVAAAILEKDVFDPTARAEWLGLFNANADWLVRQELMRRAAGRIVAREVEGAYQVPDTGFVLVGKADRIDRNSDGQLVIYDYKTGRPPSAAEIMRFDRQLVLEAVMAEAGSFRDMPPETVAHVAHIGVGRTPEERVTALNGANETVTVSRQIAQMLSAILDPGFGFISARAVESRRFEGAYDHLARFGEWDVSKPALPETLT